MTAGLACLALAFLAGSIPFGLIIGRLVRGVDVRRHGSGNLGATNVLRVVGPGWGLLALLLDAGKGFAAVACLPVWMGLLARPGVPAASGSPWPLAASLAATAGHLFPPWTRFRGGKGVATALGAWTAIDPLSALCGVAGFLIAVAIWRIVSIGSQLMVALFPLATLAGGRVEPLGPAVAAGLALALLVAWRHGANWRRLRRGEEPRLGRRR